METQWNIKGQTCLITGGASGIGARCVESFLREEAKFVAVLDIDEEKGKALVQTLDKKYSGKTAFVKCNVGDEESVTEAFNSVVNRVKHLNTIINNAGILNDSEHVWRHSCDVNRLGVVSFNLLGIKHMRKDQGGAGGTIINVSSIAAFYVSPSIPIYSANKAAVLHFSRCISQDPFHSTTGIRVMTICYAGTDTPILQGIEARVVDPLYGQKLVNDFNSKQWQRPESAAAACVAIFKNGTNGSVWLSQIDAPPEDVTPTITQAFDSMASIVKTTDSQNK